MLSPSLVRVVITHNHVTLPGQDASAHLGRSGVPQAEPPLDVIFASKELRQNASRYLALVKGGETVEVTERGTLVALLSPRGNARNARDRSVAAGRPIPAATRTGRLHSARPVLVAAGEPTNEELLDAEREERL